MIKDDKEISHIVFLIEKYLECKMEKSYIIVKKNSKINK